MLTKSFIASILHDSNAQFSPDGNKIAFQSSRSGKGHEIWVCNRDGSNPAQLIDTVGRGQGTPPWSPDSRWFVFDSQAEDGHMHVLVIEAAGEPPRLLTPFPSDEIVPSWSHDGNEFISGQTGPAGIKYGRFPFRAASRCN